MWLTGEWLGACVTDPYDPGYEPCTDYWDGTCMWTDCGDSGIGLDYCDFGGGEGGGSGGGETGGGNPVGTDDGGECGPNHFTVHDGNARREILELAQTVNFRSFSWRRYHNTRSKGGGNYFGVAGGWRHSWQYELVAAPYGVGSVKQYELIYPSGYRQVFSHTADDKWTLPAGLPEKLTEVSDGFVVTTARGRSLHFVHHSISDAKEVLRLREIIPVGGEATKLDYDAAGNLIKVTEPMGHYYQIRYGTQSFQRSYKVTLGKISGDGWQQLDIPSSVSTTKLRYVRVREPDGTAIQLSNVEFYRAGSTKPLIGKTVGLVSSSSASNLLSTSPDTVNWYGIDLGGSGMQISSIRVRAVGDQHLQDLEVEGYYLATETQTYISGVTSSDGRSVGYRYEVATDQDLGGQDVALVAADYEDGTQANYRYSRIIAGRRPLLVEADDPRYVGKAQHIIYTYHSLFVDYGTLKSEINPSTGRAYATLAFDKGDPSLRKVSFSDSREVVFHVAPRGNIMSRTDSLGRTVKFERDVAGKVTAIIDHNNARTDISYDASGRLVQRSVRGTALRAIRRNALGQALDIKDDKGRSIQYGYDARNRLTSIQTTDGKKISIQLNDAGLVESSSKPDGVHRFEYDGKGRRTKWTKPDGSIVQFEYDAYDRVSQVTDVLGMKTQIARNSRGLVTSIKRTNGTTQQLQYDKYGRVVNSIDGVGRTTNFTYDDLGRVVKLKSPTGLVTDFDYAELPQGCSSCSLSNNASTITASDGRTIKFLYDSEGRMLSRTEAAGTAEQATTLFDYDIDGNITSIEDALGNVTKYTYDDRGRRLTKTDPEGRTTQWNYDDDSLVTKIVSPNKSAVSHVYDSIGQRTSTTDAAGNVITREFDSFGNISALTDQEKNNYRFIYDNLGRRIGIMHPDGSRESWSYGLDGRLDLYTSRSGNTRRFYYNGDNRIYKEVDDRGVANITTAYCYDTNGRILSADNGIAQLSYTYDENGLLQRETTELHVETPAAKAFSITYKYDSSGRRIAATYPDRTLTYGISTQGRVKSIDVSGVGRVASYEYNAIGQRTAITRQNGVRSEYYYNKSSNVSKITHRSVGSVIKSIQYQYDLAGRRSMIVEDGDIASFAYDLTGQIVGARYSSTNDSKVYNNTLIYDKLGNRISCNTSSTVVAYKINKTNQYTSVSSLASGDTAPQYDLDGNMIGDANWEYLYDARGRLARIQSAKAGAGGIRVELGYDPKGRCVIWNYFDADDEGAWIWSRTKSRLLRYDRWNLIEEDDMGGNAVRTYVHGPEIDEIVLQSSAEGRYFPVVDGLGSTIALTGTDGTVAYTIKYNVDGQAQAFSASGDPVEAIPTRFLFMGREWHHEGGVYDFRNRVYSPSYGRFLQPDPKGFGGGDVNLYRAFFNSASNNRDPSGLCVIFLLDTDNIAALGYGHAGVLVGTDSGGWTYYSFAPVWGSNLTVTSYATLGDALGDAEITRYELYLAYFTTPAQDAAARTNAATHVNETYHPTSNNCGHVAGAIVHAAVPAFTVNSWKPEQVFSTNLPNAQDSGGVGDRLPEVDCP